MDVVNEFEVWKGKFLFYHLRKFCFDGFGPLAYEDDELVDVPCNSPPWYLGVVAYEFGLLSCGLRTEIFFCPHCLVLKKVDSIKQS